MNERFRARRCALVGRPGRVLWLAMVALLPVMMFSACASAAATRSTNASATAHPGPLVYVALGASDGVGVGTSDPARDNWPAVLSGELGQPVRLVNLSVSGETVGQALNKQVPVALKDKPDIITVWLAVNDLVDGVSLSTYTDQLTALLHSLRTGTHAHIYVGNVPDLALLPAAHRFDTAALTKVINQWNAAIAKVAKAQGATLVDLYSGAQELARNPEYVSSDGFHPSTAGALRLAQFFAAIIRTSLASPVAA